MATGSSARDFQWTAYEQQQQQQHSRGPPPLPSLPPWALAGGAAASPVHHTTHNLQSISRPPENGDPTAGGGGGWRRPTSYFGAMKRLPAQASYAPGAPGMNSYAVPLNEDEEQRRYAQQHQQQQQQNQYHVQYPPQYQQPQYPSQQQLQYPQQYQYQPQQQPPNPLQYQQPQYQHQSQSQAYSQQQYHAQQPQPQQPEEDNRSNSSSGLRREWLYGNDRADPVSSAATVASKVVATTNQRDDDHGGYSVTGGIDEEPQTPPATEQQQQQEAKGGKAPEDGDTGGSATPVVETATPPTAVAPLATDGAFFRPWKSAIDSNSNSNNSRSSNNGEDEGDGELLTANKWKVRALLNPFAKRKTSTKPQLQQIQQQQQQLQDPEPVQPAATQQHHGEEEEENPAMPSPLPQVRSKAPPRRITAAHSNNNKPSPSDQHQPAPVRPRTPVGVLLAPAPIQMATSSSSSSLQQQQSPVQTFEPRIAPTRQQHPSRSLPLRPSRSREAKLQLPQLASTPSSISPDQQDELPLALANINDLRRSTAVLKPIESSTVDQRFHKDPTNEIRDDDDANANTDPTDDDSNGDDAGYVMKTAAVSTKPPPTQLQQLKLQQKQQNQKNKKGATLDKLNEIKRKRDERRNAQAEEKQRMQTELKQHGDDAGYKFRRLITKFRDALPAHQKPGSQSQSSQTSQGSSQPNQASSSSSTQRLCVFVRKRPLAKKELKAKGYDILTCLFAQSGGATKQQPPQPPQPHRGFRTELTCHEPKLKVDCSESLENHAFHFDGVFDDDQDNTAVYSATVGPLVPFLVQGVSSSSSTSSSTAASLTVFAYGQTGSGKTYTMKSMYRQAASDLFARLAGRSVCVGVSFYEIYMNQVNDLLNQRTRVQLMEDGDGVVQLLGLREITITGADELMELIQIGEESRATSANAVHDDSSRSHALLRVTIYQRDAGGSGAGAVVLARLSMVDLAGSERACDTQSDAKSTRMEGAEINKSLLALKECIRALDRGATHIPFRQSKLTQLLRDSFLCANSKTVMIATVSPWSESCNHTLNTLRYADRLKEIGSAN